MKHGPQTCNRRGASANTFLRRTVGTRGEHMKIYIVIIIILTSAITTFAWEKIYGGPDDEIPYSMKPTSDSGLVIVGRRVLVEDGETDIFLLKTDADGDTLWAKTYGDTIMKEIGSSVAERPEGGFVIAGCALYPFSDYPVPYSAAEWYGRATIIITDSSGNEVGNWFLGDYEDYTNSYALRSVTRTEDNYYIAVGAKRSAIGLQWIFYMKFSITAEEVETVWTREYSEGQVSTGNSIARTQSNKFITTGQVGYFPPTLYIGSINTYCDSLWMKRDFPIYTTDSLHPVFGSSIALARNGNILCIGEYRQRSGPITGFSYLLMIDSLGNSIWWDFYNHDLSYYTSAVEMPDSGFLLAGYSNNAIDNDIRLRRINKYGDSLWCRSIGDSDYERGKIIAEKPGGGYIICGSHSSDDSVHDVLLIAVDSLGNDLSRAVVGEKNYSRPLDMAISAHPNPFNSAVAISVPEGWEVEIIDIKGRQVETLGGGKRTWRPKATLGSGIYLLRATALNGDTTTKRIVYLK